MQEVRGDDPDDPVRRILAASWWMLFPAFTLLVTWLAYDRGCHDPLELLPSLMARPMMALGVAGVYLLAHIWCVAAYVHSVRRAGRFVPAASDLRRIWRADIMKVAAFIVVLMVEQLPRGVWVIALQRLWHC